MDRRVIGIAAAAWAAAGCLSAPPDVTAAPADAAVASGEDAGGEAVVETLVVPVLDCPVQTGTAVLAEGVVYRLRVFGQVSVGSELVADADYFWSESAPDDIRDLSNDVDLGLAVDDLSVDEERLPDWGDYRDDHRYEADLIGQGTPIVAQFHDTACGNNAGSLTLLVIAPEA